MNAPKPTHARVDRIRALLKGIETGDPDSVLVVSPDEYIQHNPQTHSGRSGLADLFARLATTSPRVNVVRAFQDGDFVFGHTEYDFSQRRVGFEVFRFEGEYTVEHWDNIQLRLGPNPSGHSMVDGTVEAQDHAMTETNRDIVRSFVNEVLIGSDFNALGTFVSTGEFIEHAPAGLDGFDNLHRTLCDEAAGPDAVAYSRLHRVLVEGNFALAGVEGARGGVPSAFYHLYRLADGKIVERWDTIEKIAPPEEWKHQNGKF
ncbi:MAG: nuclear transport factor 2 family protein [Pseudomonadota bacterium]